MVRFFKSAEGVLREIPQNEPGCWIDVIAPDATETEWLLDNLDIPREFLSASLDEEESSHIESDDTARLIVVDIPYVTVDESRKQVYSTMPIGIIITERNAVTVSLRENTLIEDFAAGRVKNVNTAFRTKFVLQILMRATQGYLACLKSIDRCTTELEMKLRRSMRNKELTDMLDYEKALVYFQTSLKANELTLNKIAKNSFIKLYDEDRDFLEDVMIELRQALEMCNIYLNILSGTMDAFASLISNNLNIVMKVLTSLTLVMSIPTMIFSFYGMNIGDLGLPGASTIVVPILLAVLLTAGVTAIFIAKGLFK